MANKGRTATAWPPRSLRYREWVLHPSVDLVRRLEALAQQERGAGADAKQWTLDMLDRVATAMEQEVAKAAAKKNLVQLIDAAGRPQLTVAPLVLPAGATPDAR